MKSEQPDQSQSWDLRKMGDEASEDDLTVTFCRFKKLKNAFTPQRLTSFSTTRNPVAILPGNKT